MANRQKYTRGSLGHLLAHFERKKDDKGEYYKFGNQDIDITKSNQNYNLAAIDQPLPQNDFIHKRMHDVYCLNRKNVNVMMTWCVTLPQEMNDKGDEEIRKFFENSYEFLKKRYGKENVISAYVHMDESGQPHLHFAYTPVCYDKKNKRLSFNAKVVGSKSDLNSFHKDINKYLTNAMGYETGVITGETEVNLTIKQLKALRKREAELQKKIEEQVIEMPKTTLGTVKKEDAEKLVEANKVLAEALVVSQEQNKLLEAKNKLLERDSNYKEVKRLRKELETLKFTYNKLVDIVNTFISKFNLTNQFNRLIDVFNSVKDSRNMTLDERTKFNSNMKKYNELYLEKNKSNDIDKEKGAR